MIQIGRFRIDRVADLEDVRVPTARGFPELTREMLQRHAERLGPRYVDPRTLELIMSFQSFVVRAADRVILIDTCIGNDKERPHHAVLGWSRRRGDYLDRLAALGLKPEDVDVVMCTHLHVDHVGWNTRLVDGKWVPTFPNARYVIAEPEYRHWLAQHEQGDRLELATVTAGSGVVHGAFRDSVLPVVESGQAEFVGSSHELQPGVRLESAPGHSPGAVMVHIEDSSQHAVCCGDVVHHPFQFSCPAMRTTYCEDPALAARTRVAFCERYADSRTLVLPAHFAAPSAGRISKDGVAYRFEFENGF